MEKKDNAGQCDWDIVDANGLDSRVYAHLICRKHGEFIRVKIQEKNIRIKRD
jgi:hypothetical protein